MLFSLRISELFFDVKRGLKSYKVAPEIEATDKELFRRITCKISNFIGPGFN